MNNYEVHKCQYQSSGVRVERSEDYFYNNLTWQLVIMREATEIDLENNHVLEQVGEEIWSTVVEINNCPYCGEKLRDTTLDSIKFSHFDSSGWSLNVS